jgi:hypothetical protein
MKYNCVEQTVDFRYKDADNKLLAIRLWIDITFQESESDKVLEILKQLTETDPIKIIDELALSVPHINAIQVISPGGIGVVAYTTDFKDDVHG